MMKTSELIRLFEEFRARLQEHFNLWCASLSSSIPDKPVRNHDELERQQRVLVRLFYVLDPYLTRLSKVRFMHTPATGVRWDIYRSAIGNDTAPMKGPSAKNALLELEGILALLEARDPNELIGVSTAAPGTPKRVFVSHGKETPALTRVERFIRGLGLVPVIVKNEPSLGKALDDLVEEQMQSCECAVILATLDDFVDGRHQPRSNVIHEIGLGQEKLTDRLIYLKEEGCDFPSNISPKVWENFTQENLENAFLKLGKELRAFGLIS